MDAATNRRAQRKELYRSAARVAAWGLAINLLLGVAKLAAGLYANVFALVADAVNSLGDVFMSAVVLYALRVAQQPANYEHPYGYPRAEAIAGSHVALLVAISALLVGWEAFHELGAVHGAPPWWTLVLAAANVVIKEALYWFNIRIGKQLGSSALLAGAWDHRSDALCSLAVLLGLSTIVWGGPEYAWADDVATLVVVLIIVFSSLTVFRQAITEQLDFQGESELVADLRKAAAAVPGVQQIDKLWTRKAGLEFFVEIHVQVDPTCTVELGHKLGHDVKGELLKQFPNVRDVLVHLEPAG